MRASIHSATRAFGLVLTFSSALLLLPRANQAALPETLNYQGRLTSAGAPVPDSTGNTVQFQLCLDSGCGSVVWTELWDLGTSHVSTKNGLFNVALGTHQSLSAVAFDQPYWLEVQWTNLSGTPETLLPRQPLTSAPYAFRARSVSAPLNLNGTLPGAVLSGSNGDSIGAGVRGFGSAGFANSTGVEGFGGRGVVGSSTAGGGTGVLALQGSGSHALRVSGNAEFNGMTDFLPGSTVDFTGATVMGLASGVPVPLSLTGNDASNAIITGVNSNATGIGIAGMGQTIGVSGTATLGGSGIGVRGQADSLFGAGVWGMNPSGIGVHGDGVTGVYAHGTQYGVSVTASGAGATGVIASVSSSNYAMRAINNGNGYGMLATGMTSVAGVAPFPNAIGVLASSNNQAGAVALKVSGPASFAGSVDFTGATVTGLPMLAPPVSWILSHGAPLLTVSNTGAGRAISAYAANEVAVIGQSPNAAGVAGVGVAGFGVYAQSDTNAALFASSTAGVNDGVIEAEAYGAGAALLASGGAAAVSASAKNSGATAVYGYSDFAGPGTTFGVRGISQAQAGYGVHGLNSTPSGTGVYGYGGTGVWGEGFGGGGTGVRAWQGAGVWALDVSGSARFAAGNVDFSGATVTGLAMNVVAPLSLTSPSSAAAIFAFNASGSPALMGRGLLGVHGDADAAGGVGVLATNGFGGTAMRATAAAGTAFRADGGIVAVSATALSASGMAIYANNPSPSSGWTVLAEKHSGNSAAIRGYNKASTGAAVSVEGISLADQGIAVRGETGLGGNTGVGVFGLNSGAANAGAGVQGQNSSASGSGVYGLNVNNIGVRGQGRIGVLGQASGLSTVALLGDWANQGGSLALKVSGPARFDMGSVTFASHVDFSGALVTGLPMGGGPLSVTAAIAHPGAVFYATNSGNGHGIFGVATQSGSGGGVNNITAGVYGYSAQSRSAGVLGYSPTTSGVGVYAVGGPSGGVGLIAQAGGGGTALRLSGSAVMDAAPGLTITVASYVDFTAGTNFVVAAPLSLTSPGAVTTISAFNNSGGTALLARSTVGSSIALDVEAPYSGTGLLARSSPGGYSIHSLGPLRVDDSAGFFGPVTFGAGLAPLTITANSASVAALAVSQTAFGGTAAMIDSAMNGISLDIRAGQGGTGIHARMPQFGIGYSLISEGDAKFNGSTGFYGQVTFGAGLSPLTITANSTSVAALSVSQTAFGGTAAMIDSTSNGTSLDIRTGAFGTGIRARMPQGGGGYSLVSEGDARFDGSTGFFGPVSFSAAVSPLTVTASTSNVAAIIASNTSFTGDAIIGRVQGSGTGVAGQASTGGIGVRAMAPFIGPGWAFRSEGDSRFDGQTGFFGPVTFNALVDFSSATVIGLSLSGPLSVTAAIAHPGAIFYATNSGTGHGVYGEATKPGWGAAGATITAGVYGYSSQSLSAGVLARNTHVGLQAAGVFADAANAFIGESNFPGGVGGDFKGNSGTGVKARGITAVAATASAMGGLGARIAAYNFQDRALEVEGTSSFFADNNGAAMSVSQASSQFGAGAIMAYSAASGTAAIRALNTNTEAPAQNSMPGIGVWAEAPVGMAAFSTHNDGIGLYAQAGGSTQSAGIRVEHMAGGVGIEAESNAGTAIYARGVTALAANSYIPGGVAVYAYATSGARALEIYGDSVFNFPGSGAQTKFNGYVDFAGATVTGLAGGGSVPNPLFLSNTVAGPVITALNGQGGGVGIQGINVAGSSNEIGVYGQVSGTGANSPAGVLGVIGFSTNTPFGGAGVVGNGGDVGHGVYATSQNSAYASIYARHLSAGAGAIGVLGEVTASSSDPVIGVMGALQSPPIFPMPATSTAVYGHGGFWGHGVQGTTDSNALAGVLGRALNGGVGGIGVLGEAYETSTGLGVVGAKQFGFDRNSVWAAVGSSGGGVYGMSANWGDFGVAGYASGNARVGVLAVSSGGGPGLIAQGAALGAEISAMTTFSGQVTGLMVSATTQAAFSGVAVGLSVSADFTNFGGQSAIGAAIKARGDYSAIGLTVTSETAGGPNESGFGIRVLSNRTGIHSRAVDDFGNSPAGYAVIGEGVRVGVHGLATRTAGGPMFGGIGVLAESSYVALSAVAKDDFTGNSGVAIYAAGRTSGIFRSEYFDTFGFVRGISLSAENYNNAGSQGAIGLDLYARSYSPSGQAIGISVTATGGNGGFGKETTGLLAEAVSPGNTAYGVVGRLGSFQPGAGVRGEVNVQSAIGGDAGVQAVNLATASMGNPSPALDIDGSITMVTTRVDRAAGQLSVTLGGGAGSNPCIQTGNAVIATNQIRTNSLILLTVVHNGALQYPITARISNQTPGQATVEVHAVGQGGGCPGVGNVIVNYLIINQR